MGRLDLNAEGLLLLTNDGELANRLTHPKKEVDKVYLVWLSRYIPGCEASIASPIEIDGRTTRPAKVETLRAEDETALLRITNPEASLSDLALLSNPPVTKSCLSHRLKKIMSFVPPEEDAQKEK